MEDIAKILKIFFEEHLIPALIAIVLGLLTLSFLPSDFWVINKIGLEWTRILLFGLFFLAVEFCDRLRKIVPVKISNKRYERRQRKEQEQEIIEDFQRILDHLTKYELELINDLVKNDNKPVKRVYMYGSNIHSEYLNNEYRNYPWGDCTFVGGADFQNRIFICVTQYEGNVDSNYGKLYRVYKLQENAYKLAKYIIETKGRLSSYEEAERNA